MFGSWKGKIKIIKKSNFLIFSCLIENNKEKNI